MHNRHDCNVVNPATDGGTGSTIAFMPDHCYSSELCGQLHPCHTDNYLESSAYPVEEVDAASSPSDGGAMSVSDAERLDCASASDESGLLLGGCGDGDAALNDDDDVDALLRIAPFAHWWPHAAACGGGGDEAMRDHALEWGSPAAEGEQRDGGCAAGEHDGARPGECGDGEVRRRARRSDPTDARDIA